MNGKKARALRKYAKELMPNAKQVLYDYHMKQKKRLVLLPDCVRYIYQRTKRSL